MARHGVVGKRLGRNVGHRKALLKNLATSVIAQGLKEEPMERQVVTTVTRAKQVRGLVERLITYAKQGDLAARREAARFVTRRPPCRASSTSWASATASAPAAIPACSSWAASATAMPPRWPSSPWSRRRSLPRPGRRPPRRAPRSPRPTRRWTSPSPRAKHSDSDAAAQGRKPQRPDRGDRCRGPCGSRNLDRLMPAEPTPSTPDPQSCSRRPPAREAFCLCARHGRHLGGVSPPENRP